jgi:two-component sensor histidine kinase
MPARFVKVDLVDRLVPFMPPLAAQAVIALACAGLAVLARGIVDLFLPGAGPFALTLPFVLFATLFGRWQTGAGVMTFCAIYAWYAVLPVHYSFVFETPADGPRVAINVLSGFMIVALAEYFRRVVRRSLAERDAIAEERRLLLDEVDHRVKNNFAMVSAMIRMEMRASPGEAAESLGIILGRVESIARAHEALYRGNGGVGEVPMRPYLVNLCASLNTAYFDDEKAITTNVDAVALPRDKAIAVGLVVNELCTNAAKHAFPDRDDGRVQVHLENTAEGIVVSVSDNGVGIGASPARDGSLGQGLVEAFAQQAGGRLERVAEKVGATFRLVLPLTG